MNDLAKATHDHKLPRRIFITAHFDHLQMGARQFVRGCPLMRPTGSSPTGRPLEPHDLAAAFSAFDWQAHWTGRALRNDAPAGFLVVERIDPDYSRNFPLALMPTFGQLLWGATLRHMTRLTVLGIYLFP
jgi:hypothetical protein